MAAKNGSTKGSTQSRKDRADARETIDLALAKLADVRDLLRELESGRLDRFRESASCLFARAALEEAAKEIEGSCYELGVLRRSVDELTCGGWFIERHPREARHG